MKKEVLQRLYPQNVTPNDEMYLKKLISEIIFMVDADTDETILRGPETMRNLKTGKITPFKVDKNERLKIVADDLFKHCTTANIAGFGVEELEDFYLACVKTGFFVKAWVLEGKSEFENGSVCNEIANAMTDFKCDVAQLYHQHALLVINYHNEPSADDIESMIWRLRTHASDDEEDQEEMIVTWSALYDKNLPENTFRVDLLLCGDEY